MTSDGEVPTDGPRPADSSFAEEFAEKVVIVTGANGGIGRALVETLLRRGASIVAQDLDPAVEHFGGDSARVVPVVGDVSDAMVARACVSAATDRFGRLDVLINNAGRPLNRPVAETTDDDWDDVMATNARGSFVQSREAFRYFAAHGGGAIVAILSYAAVVALPEGSAYAASKGAIAALTKVLAIEGAPKSIRANAVLAGVVDTGFLEPIRPDGRDYLRSFADAQPLGRIGTPEEIAEAALFLASERATFITGALLSVDGGFTAQ